MRSARNRSPDHAINPRQESIHCQVRGDFSGFSGGIWIESAERIQAEPVLLARQLEKDEFMSEAHSLRDASVQDLQLELIRRTRFNALDGERVYSSLLRHRHLWLAALLDRPGVPNYASPSLLLTAGLIKLRDLPDNLWNADTLFVLTPTARAVGQLAKIAGEEDWGGEVQIHSDQEDIDSALGSGRQGFGLLSVWWD